MNFDLTAEVLPTKVTVVAGPDQISTGVFGGKATVELSGTLVARIRVVVNESVLSGRSGKGGIGLAELEIPGVTAARTLAVPEVAGPVAAAVFTAAPGTPACYFSGTATRCNPDLFRRSPDGGRIDRTIGLSTGGAYRPQLWARPLPGAALEKLIDETMAASAPAGATPAVVASSRSVTEPAGRPGAVVDGDSGTLWYAGEDDDTPSLRMTWPTPRTITGLRITFETDAAATRPEAVTIIGADGTRGGLLDPQGIVQFDRPMRTAEIAILLLNRNRWRSYDPVTNTWERLPFGVGEITVLPAAGTTAASPDKRVDLPCGSGPTVEVGGAKLTSRISATLRDLVELREVPATLCDKDAVVRLYSGQGRIVVAPSTLAEPTRLSLIAAAVPAGAESAVTVGEWGAVRRTIGVSPAKQGRVLVVRENTNPGWSATMGGFTLAPVVLDGWQQGWYVPAGLHGPVVLSFTPDIAFQSAIFGGGAVALALGVVAIVPQAPRLRTRVGRLSRRRRWLAMALGAVALALAGGAWSGGIALGILLLLAGYRIARRGLSTVDRRRGRLTVTWLRNWLPSLLVLAAGVASWSSAEPYRAAVPQLCALGAMVLLWLGLLGRPMPSRRPVRQLLPRQFDGVVADRGQGQAAPEYQHEGPAKVAGELRAPSRPVDQSDHQRVP
jgi:arabinofuranan 3-O-arabinosyltransferase